jgi:hypothetical protein
MNIEHSNDGMKRLAKILKMIVQLIGRSYAMALLFEIEDILFQKTFVTHTDSNMYRCACASSSSTL